MKMRVSTHNYLYCILLLGIVIFQSCQKGEEVGVDPYTGGKEPFGITFTSTRTDPEIGLPGEVIRVNVKGLKKYENQFEFRLSEVNTEIVALSDSTLDFRIPAEVSSGMLTVVLNGQIFFGPRVSVEGKVSVDSDYKLVNGFNSSVNQLLANAGGHIVVGSFTDFENQATDDNIIRGIHQINSLGESGGSLDFRRSATGSISSITRLSTGEYVIGGYLTEFSKRQVGGIARLKATGSLDTTTVEVINPEQSTKPLNGLDTVSTFNAGFTGGVLKVFATDNDAILAVGSFGNHYRIDYNYSSRENRRFIYSKVSGIAKVRYDGTLDSAFNYNNTGFNGSINDAVKLNDGRLVIVGSFTMYNGKRADNIVCINPDGTVDESFTAAGGANRSILTVTYNPTTDKIVLSGSFNRYAGAATNGVLLLKNDGAVDPTFTLGNIEGGAASYAYSLNNGRVLVTGGFEKYNGIQRSGLLILESDGTARQEYNNMGTFAGIPLTIVETTSSLGNPAVLLGGSIFAVDGKMVGNLVKIEIKN